MWCEVNRGHVPGNGRRVPDKILVFPSVFRTMDSYVVFVSFCAEECR